MRLFKSLILLLLILSPFGLNAQISHGGNPMPWRLGESTLRAMSDERVVLPSIDTAEIRTQSAKQEMRCGAERFAYAFQVDFTPENSGVLYRLADGTQVWRLHIVSEGAYSLNIIFDEYQLDNRSRLFLYNPDRSVVLGSFTSENNSPSGVLATAPVTGDEVVVELIMPAESDTKLRLGSVNHDYVGLRKLPTYDTSAGCQVDACEVEGHELQMRSSVLYIIDGTTFCSGNMINNVRHDGTPYLITSTHCFFDRHDSFVPEKAERSVFFFNYEKPHCLGGVKGTTEMSVAGANVAFALVTSDAMVLRLSDRPPLDYRVYYAGWNLTEQPQGPFYSLHHACSDMLKISVEEDDIHIGSFDYNNLFLPNKHWWVENWELGIMEGGSSGAALFDESGLVLGSLSGGATSESCSSPGYDTYWAMRIAWPEGLGDLLDPDHTQTQRVDGMEANENPCRRLTNWEEADEIHSMARHEQYAAGHNSAGIDEYAERFSLGAEKSVLYGIHFMAYEGTYSERDEVSLRVYSGDSLPGDVVTEERIRLSATEYVMRFNQFRETAVGDWSLRDNYFRLQEPIVVDSILFIGVKLDNMAETTFALCHTDGMDRKRNSAFYNDGGVWHPFEGHHPYYPYPTALFIEPEVQVGCGVVATKDHIADEGVASLLTNPVSDCAWIAYPKEEQLMSYEIYNIRGEKMDVKEVACGASPLRVDTPYASGLYLIRLMFESHVETLKMVKR